MTSQATLTKAGEKRAATLIYFAAFSFVMMIGSMQVLVPLYALHLGYDIKALGFIISAQAVLPLFSRFFAGAMGDMFGDRWVLVASFAAMTAAAVTFAISGAFWALIAGQVLQGVGRSAYHVIAQSYASRINPNLAATRLGRLGSSGNAGAVLGTAVGGFRGASLLKPNLREAEMLAGVKMGSANDLRRIASRLQAKIGGGAVVVTRGPDGMSVFEGDGPELHVPTVAREVFDVQGAGDTAIAALTLSLRAGASLHEAAVIANAASGVVVGKVGTATASADEVKRLLPEALVAARGGR